MERALGPTVVGGGYIQFCPPYWMTYLPPTAVGPGTLSRVPVLVLRNRSRMTNHLLCWTFSGEIIISPGRPKIPWLGDMHIRAKEMKWNAMLFCIKSSHNWERMLQTIFKNMIIFQSYHSLPHTNRLFSSISKVDFNISTIMKMWHWDSASLRWFHS